MSVPSQEGVCMWDETKPGQRSSFAKRFLTLEKQVAELREYLNLPPVDNEPDRSIIYVIANVADCEEPTSEGNSHLGYVLHMTTDPQIAHELFQVESARTPGEIRMYVYREFSCAELTTRCDFGDEFAAVYLSSTRNHTPLRINAPLHAPIRPAKNRSSDEAA